MRARFRDRLQAEFDKRRTTNPRFSLRAFARLLDTEHATLSQILRGERPTPVGRMRVWGKRLGIEAEETAAYIATEHLPEMPVAQREAQLRYWAAESAAI